eukprot:122098_1
MSNSLQDKVVCFTGRLTRVRRVARQELEAAGGIFASAISSRVDIVIAGKDAGGKLDDAERMNIEIWNEDDFDNTLKSGSPKRKKRKRSRSSSPPAAPKKKKRRVCTKKVKPKCKYGSDCYQKEKQHRRDYSHPLKHLDDLSSDDDGEKDKNESEERKKGKQENDEDGDVEIHDDASEGKDIELCSDDQGEMDQERRADLEQMWKTQFDVLNDGDCADIPDEFHENIKDHNIALTGWCPVPRHDLIRLVQKCGGRITNTIDDECQLLIVGERPGLKLFEANELGIPTLYYTKMWEMLGVKGVITSSQEY